jgi:hypothetical protein
VARTSKADKLNRPEAPTLTARLLRDDDWPTIKELFGPNGACGGCWCMWWRVPQGGKLWDGMKGKNNRAAFQKLVESGEVHGVLAFSGLKPVGWCSFGPRCSHPRLERVRALRRDSPERTWSILCFYIPSAWRRRGVARLLLKEATARAFHLGAREVESLCVDGCPSFIRSRRLQKGIRTKPGWACLYQITSALYVEGLSQPNQESLSTRNDASTRGPRCFEPQ